jgi:NADPH:quinone reductase-like Zn-dependent oxidoreductase
MSKVAIGRRTASFEMENRSRGEREEETTVMRQVWIPRTGGPEVLEVREAPDPTPGAGQVRIRVAASGVNFADAMTRIGLYPDAPKLPTVVGYEVSGVVDAVGSGVSADLVGQHVLALTRFGGNSDVVVVPVDQAVPIGGLDLQKAAALPVTYLTAWVMLVWLGNVKPGDRVLVHAAAGGVGVAAVQICRWRGAEVIGTASASKHERLRGMGVAHCIDYRTQDFEAEVMRVTEGRGVDLALDAVGGESYAKSYRCLAPLGRLYVFGASSFAPGERRSLMALLKGAPSLLFQVFRPMAMMSANKGVHGVNLAHLWHATDKLQAMLREILGLVHAGHLDPIVDAVFPFERAGEAHAYLQGRKNFGKVLLVPGQGAGPAVTG